MTGVVDPGPFIVDKILDDLEEAKWSPTDVARQARRLRAHIEALRREITDLNSGRLHAPDIDAIAGEPVNALECVTGTRRRFDPTGGRT